MAASQRNKELISRLLTNYNKLSGWRRWLFPIKFTEATQEEDTFTLCHVLLNSWFSSFWRAVFPFLDSFAQSDLYHSCRVVDNFGLLTEANFNLVAAHENPNVLWDALTSISIYHKEKFYDKFQLDLVFFSGSRAQANFQRIVIHKNPTALIDAFDSYFSYSDFILQSASVHNLNTILQTDLDTIATSSDAPSQVVDALHLLYCSQKKIEEVDRLLITQNPSLKMVQALCFVKQAGLLRGELSQAIRDLLIKSSNPFDSISIVYYLQLEGVLTGKMGQEICTGEAIAYSPKEIPQALKALQDFHLSSDENRFKLLTACYSPSILINILACLQENNLLAEPITCQLNFDLAFKNAYLRAFGSMVSSLHLAGLLDLESRGQENYFKITEFGEALAPLLLLLSKNNLLNQEIFDRINQHKTCLGLHLWQNIPTDAFREEHILEVLRICDDRSTSQLSKMSSCIRYIKNTILKKEQVRPSSDEPTPADNKNDMDATPSFTV
ncbi:hypothetical protein OQJ18_09405 [Fluoribacter dumoffii]|uniref:Uncharacterized protein n=1 Tax=Fluoribacter dumoffii TaxID=463 RepID=A0A377G6U1_9GAMM|nr:hypothetical protein [Fluoribacter dumoffii]KTC89423.1 hypothetical protein Ldum_0491 [Fluoribacter dumoffii NY 23]MCW8386780.1 hypothetical protein [Fluoribacter dumoffii]MCW8417685.1 hypothetical protein [Fluoribacter dumoffii]MCW8454473.1 hypothetical protein [Fluoribacter dumoffii]MCW8461453.1 hypothetical protein [Fluoribacter dumoffii]